jgi:hypothetical protein
MVGGSLRETGSTLDIERKQTKQNNTTQKTKKMRQKSNEEWRI